MRASLSKQLQSVEWGNYRIGNLFEKIDTIKLPYKADDLPKQATGKYTLPCLTSSFKNQGLNYFVPREGATILKDVISIPSNSDVYRAYFQSKEFTVLSDAYAIQWKSKDRKLTPNQYLFMVMCINKVTDRPIYSYKNKLGGWKVVKDKYIHLPRKDGSIDLEFMESFMSEAKAIYMMDLKAYLSTTGLNNCTLTKSQESMLHLPWAWKQFEISSLFDISKTSSFDSDRLVPGNEYDYVTRTSLNQGILQCTGEVSNAVANDAGTWSLGLLQMDFFYRKKPWYAGQFVRKIVSKIPLSEKQALFITVMLNTQKNKLLSVLVRDVDKAFLGSKIWLPAKGETIDFDVMEDFITAVQKITIKDLVAYCN